MTDKSDASEWDLVIVGGPWGERIGKRCRLSEVPPDEADRAERLMNRKSGPCVFILIEDDIVDPYPLAENDWWSCIIGIDCIEPDGSKGCYD